MYNTFYPIKMRMLKNRTQIHNIIIDCLRLMYNKVNLYSAAESMILCS